MPEQQAYVSPMLVRLAGVEQILAISATRCLGLRPNDVVIAYDGATITGSGPLRRRIRELARRHIRWGRRMAYRLLRREGWTVNHKRVQRIWREEGLQRPLPRRRKRSRPPDGCRELMRGE